MEDKKFKIGEFAKLCFVTVKTLRHYEKIGLHCPREVDEWTGYRYYDVGQLEEMSKIQNLKKLGLSLEDIKIMVEDGLMKPDKALVESKMVATREELRCLTKRLQALEGLYEHAKIIKNNMSKIVIKPLPGGVVASFRRHIKSYDELGPLCVTVIRPEMQRLGCRCLEETSYCFTVDYNRNRTPEDIDLEYCEVVAERCEDSELVQFKELPLVETAVCIEHRGAYESCGDTMTAAFKYICEQPLTICGEPRFNYIHGVWDCDNVEDWLTEIQIPVSKQG